MNYYRELIERSKKVLDELNIPYSEHIVFEVSKTQSRYGDCSKLTDNTYLIRTSQRVLDTHNDVVIMNTIIHEILHTSAWTSGHRGKWKRYAEIVTNNTPYTIMRCATDEEEAEVVTPYNFRIVCNGCHKEWKMCRATRTVRACIKGTARCSCGSKNFTVYNKFNEKMG